MDTTLIGTRSWMARGCGIPATATPGFPAIRGDGCRITTAAGSSSPVMDGYGSPAIPGIAGTYVRRSTIRRAITAGPVLRRIRLLRAVAVTTVAAVVAPAVVVVMSWSWARVRITVARLILDC